VRELIWVNVLVEARRNTFKKAKADPVRLLVFDVMTEVNRRDGYSNLLLPKALESSPFDQRDKAFATELLYGTLRMQGRHDYILSQVSDRPWRDVDPGIVDVTRLGLQQIFEMRVPMHAAVSETVELARKVLGESKASFVNALLRKVSMKTLQEWLVPVQAIKDDVSRLAIIYSHPEWIVSAYFDLLKSMSEVEELLKVNNQPTKPTFVTWPGRSTLSEFADIGAKATIYSPFGFTADIPPSALEAIRHRRAGVQDEGSQLVALVFARAAAAQDSWLDLCAGPGGKAALLSSIAKEEGCSFIANEISETRAELVKRVVAGATVWVGDAREVSKRGQTFDAILADVPCTGLGALRRRPEVRWRRTVNDLKSLIELQREISDAALSILNVGGVFGYATCSPHMAETTIAVADILKRNPGVEQIDVTPFLPENLEDGVRQGAMALWTQRHNTDSMFLALFKKRA
jgi:16S rRNA (cytosine967-C5)-methyltransferase